MSTVISKPDTGGDRLKVHEIFYSLQGESRSTGLPTVFIRLTGCPLRCHYCDTEYAFSGGDWMSLEEIESKVKSFQTRHITVTGGEPLAQKRCLTLLTRLANAGLNVSLETSGAVDVSTVDPRITKVMDIKTPASGEADKNLYSNLEYLSVDDQIKFVICNRDDYEWSREIMKEQQLNERCEVLFSPEQDTMPAKVLAEWILADQLPVRFQIQLHKILWGNEPGR